MVARQSSIDAYHQIKVEGVEKTQVDRIMDYLTIRPWKNRREIAAALDMQTATVSARVNLMLSKGMLWESNETHMDEVTKKRVKIVAVPRGQLGLV